MLTTFGKRLRFLRLERGITQKKLVKALEQQGINIGQTYISVLEKAKDNKVPNGVVVAGLARELDTTTDFLLLLTDQPQKDGQHVN